jgi:hypothetical protein
MPPLVSNGASLLCSFGAAPSTLTVLPANLVTVAGMPAATIMDFTPSNILPFGMCLSLTNPQVAAATSAALGVLTPQPCIPVPTGPWTPGSPKVTIKGFKALDNTSTCMCAWLGNISIISPGQALVQG